MPSPIDIAIIVRDRPSMVLPCLAALELHTKPPIQISVVVGGASHAVRSELTRRHPNVRVIHHGAPLSQAASRRLALRAARSSRCVLMENDTLVSAGWLEPLLATADRYRAAVTTPLVIWHRGIHAAGCGLRVTARSGRDLLEHHIEYTDLNQRPIGYAETHCMLLDLEQIDERDLCDDVEPLDVDLGLVLRAKGRAAYFEPRSRVTYAAPPPFELGDVAHTLERWSLARWRACHDRFVAKWGVEYDAAAKLASYQRQELRLALLRHHPTPGTVELTNLATRLTNFLTTLATRGRARRSFG